MSTDYSLVDSNSSSLPLQWSVESVVEWLAGLRLSQDYSQLFREERIDGRSLLKLTPSHLEHQLQINNSADMSIIQQSIASLRMNVFSATLPELKVTTTSKSPSTQQEDSSRHGRLHKEFKSKSVDEVLKEGETPENWPQSYRKSVTPTPRPHMPSHMLDILKEENTLLKKELEYYYQRVCRLQKLEQELEHLSEGHRMLQATTSRKEKLEIAMRHKLEEELRQYKEASMQNEVRFHSIMRNASFKGVKPDTLMKKELARRDSVIAKLIKQNKDVTDAREQLEKDLCTMKTALSVTERQKSQEEDEQREEDDRRAANDREVVASNYSASIEKLQSILSSMLSSSQKRQELELQLRKQLEAKIVQLSGENRNDHESNREQDLRIATLEADMAKLEHKCLELLAERQLIQDAATIPRDTQICQLERQLKEKDNELANTREQKSLYMTQLEESEQKLTSYSTRIVSLEATLREKESLIETLKSLLEPDESIAPPKYSLAANCGGGPLRKQSLGNLIPASNYRATVSPVRKTSSPLPPVANYQSTDPMTDCSNGQYVANGYHGCGPPTSSLPTYDQHMQGKTCSSSLIPAHLSPKFASRSFPNTPEVQRRAGYPYSSSCYPAQSAPSLQASPQPVHRTAKPRPIYKSLTPPPHQLPVNYSPVVSNGRIQHQRVMKPYQSMPDAKSLDSDDSLDSLLSPSSPPTHSVGTVLSPSWIQNHRHSNSFPNSVRSRQYIPVETSGHSQDSGVLMEVGVYHTHL